MSIRTLNTELVESNMLTSGVFEQVVGGTDWTHYQITTSGGITLDVIPTVLLTSLSGTTARNLNTYTEYIPSGKSNVKVVRASIEGSTSFKTYQEIMTNDTLWVYDGTTSIVAPAGEVIALWQESFGRTEYTVPLPNHSGLSSINTVYLIRDRPLLAYNGSVSEEVYIGDMTIIDYSPLGAQFSEAYSGGDISFTSPFRAVRNGYGRPYVNLYINPPISSGNVYFEVFVEYLYASSTTLEIGVSTALGIYDTVSFASASTGHAYINSGKYKTNDVLTSGYGSTYVTGTTIGVRYSYNTGELEFYKDGVSQGIAAALGPNTAVYPAIAMKGYNTTVEVSFYRFTYEPPLGAQVLGIPPTRSYELLSSTDNIPSDLAVSPELGTRMSIEDASSNIIPNDNITAGVL